MLYKPIRDVFIFADGLFIKSLSENGFNRQILKQIEGYTVKFVEPIRDKENVNAVSDYIKERYGEKYFIMFEIGIHTGMRISDILNLRVSDIRGKDELVIKEQKTSTRKKKNTERFIGINSRLRSEIATYTKGMNGYWYMIHQAANNNRPVSRAYCYRVIRSACDAIGISHGGTHTMRKTFGYHYYRKNKDVAFLMRMFNHSSPDITLRYIGISREEIREAMTFSLYD